SVASHSHTSPFTRLLTLSLHSALPIFVVHAREGGRLVLQEFHELARRDLEPKGGVARLPVGRREHVHRLREHRGEVAVLMAERRSEEHTSELQSLVNIVCRLLLEKKNH